MLFGDGKPRHAVAWPAGRLNHVREFAGSTVGEALGLVLPRFCGLLAAVRDKLAEMRADAPSVRQGLLS